ncbi:MAG: non-hydrolyzing UDP-N-acetylglucosamine 2-epimerase [Anaerolineae bacterium]
MRILHVVGARPNFMKIAPVMQALSRRGDRFQQLLVHTGQHYDANMSHVFFDDLGLPAPDVYLAVGSGTHAWQTAQVMLRFEPVLLDFRPEWVVVPGDVNSTLAAALVASKLGIRVAHVEAGLRSGDRTMPEEINRILTDHLADLLFTTEPSGNAHLAEEGIPAAKVRYVGNVMIDSLVRLLPRAEEAWPALAARLALARQYILVTLHRPSNVDDRATLAEVLAALGEIAETVQVVFPVHPRTRQRIAEAGLADRTRGLLLTEPLGYLEFLALEKHAAVVLTDSGGVQEETTYLGVPCLTARPNTERPITVTAGTNRLVASERGALVAALSDALDRAAAGGRPPAPPPLWDGRAAERIAEAFVS